MRGFSGFSNILENNVLPLCCDNKKVRKIEQVVQIKRIKFGKKGSLNFWGFLL